MRSRNKVSVGSRMHSGRRDAMHDKAEEAAGVGALLSASSR